MKESCPGSKEIRSPYPESLICPFCLKENEIWSDEVEIQCTGCGKIITRDMKPNCILWCPAARQCVGAEKYDKLIKSVKS